MQREYVGHIQKFYGTLTRPAVSWKYIVSTIAAFVKKHVDGMVQDISFEYTQNSSSPNWDGEDFSTSPKLKQALIRAFPQTPLRRSVGRVGSEKVREAERPVEKVAKLRRMTGPPILWGVASVVIRLKKHIFIKWVDEELRGVSPVQLEQVHQVGKVDRPYGRRS